MENHAEMDMESAQKDLKELKTIKKKLTDAKKELEAGYNAPFFDVKQKLDELLEIVKAPMDYIDKCIKEKERIAKEAMSLS